MTAYESLWILFFLMFLGGYIGYRKYNNWFNPQTFYSLVGLGIFTLFSGYCTYISSYQLYSDSEFAHTAKLAIIHFIGFFLAFVGKYKFHLRIYSRLLNALSLDSPEIGSSFSTIKFEILIAAASVSFLMLAIFGGGGMLWITSSREAYLNYRTGAGQFYAATLWFLMFAFIYLLWTRRPRTTRKVMLYTVSFCFITYFTGSKGAVLSYLLIAIIYYNFLIKSITNTAAPILFTLYILITSALLILHGSYYDFSGLFTYFIDYYSTTTEFLARFDEFGFQYGSAWLSSFYFYVPRALFPDKPYEYGIALIHQVLFPGAAALGHTPGILGWAIAYLDFGAIGVFAYAFWDGITQRAAYEYFLERQQTFISFLFMIHAGLFPIIAFTTPIILVILCMTLSFFLRMGYRWGRQRVVSRSLLHSSPSGRRSLGLR